MSVNAFSMFEEPLGQEAAEARSITRERVRTDDSSESESRENKFHCSVKEDFYTTDNPMNVDSVPQSHNEFNQDSTIEQQASKAKVVNFEGSKMEVIKTSPSSVKRAISPSEEEDVPSPKRRITALNVQESKAMASDFPVLSERNKILQQAADVAKELVDYNKSVIKATYPFFYIFEQPNRPRRNELLETLSLAYGNADLKASAITTAVELIKSRLAEQQEGASEEDLRQASHQDALLLKHLQIAGETLRPATQEVISQGKQLVDHPFYGTKVDQSVIDKLQKLETTSLFDQIDSISHSLKMREVGDFFPTTEDKKKELKNSIEYIEAVSDYARGLAEGNLGTLLSYTIDNCGEGIELEEDICDIRAEIDEVEATLAIADTTVTKTQHYLTELEEGRGPASIQEESHVFGAIHVVAPLL